MAIRHVQNTALTSLTGGFATSATIAATWGAATQDGSLLLAVLSVNTTNATFTAPTPPSGWTKAIGGTDLSAAGEMGYIYYILNSPSRAASAETFTMTNNSTNDAGLQLYEVDVDGKGQALDKTAQAAVSNAAATTAPNSGLTAAIAQGDEYIFGVVANRNVTVPTSPVMGGTATGGAVAQWTTATSTGAAASATTQTIYDRQTTGTGTIGMSATLGTARGWNALIATFSLSARHKPGLIVARQSLVRASVF